MDEKDIPLYEQQAVQATLMFGVEGPKNRPESDRYRAAGNRSFPTGYPIPAEDFDAEQIAAWDGSVRRELGVKSGFMSGFKNAKHATSSDRRVLVGPSDEDVEVLGREIYHGWCVSRGMCQQIGLYTPNPLGNAKTREGVVLDYLTRRNAAGLAMQRGVVESEQAAGQRFGLDVIRIALDHGVTPDALAPYLVKLGLASF